jgi:helicase associated protein
MTLAVAFKQPFHSGGTNTERTTSALANRAWGKSNTNRWERGFAALTKFRAREGHSCPSRRYVEGGFRLGQWVSVQRYCKDLLPIERKRRLDAIRFVWDARDYLWEQYFSALKKFKRWSGHCCVPTIYKEGDLKLGWWVATQRRNRKEMLAERRARLNKIGFVWRTPRPYRPTGAPRHVGDPSDSGHPNCPAS